MENPRAPLEAPETWMTLVKRQRQLHDEDKSCGTQPAYIRVIYRRLGCACPVPSVHHCSEKIKPPGSHLTGLLHIRGGEGDLKTPGDGPVLSYNKGLRQISGNLKRCIGEPRCSSGKNYGVGYD
ncbi:MAG TPA: hypothetical protein ENH38_04810 [Nitrospirae bacterium]|nr:hypothetical protein [Nitrospirota bacterium]